MPKLECSIDMKNINRMIKDLNRLEEREIVVNVDDTPTEKDPSVTNNNVAIWQEFGVRAKGGGFHIPPRKFFFRGAVLWEKDIHNEAKLVLTNTLKANHTQVNKNLDKIGEKGVSSVKESIDRQGFAKLSPTTIRIKRAKNSLFPTTALVDSGSMYEAINYQIK